MPSLNMVYINDVRITHGVLAALAWVVFFPAGAISIRLLSNKWTVRIHAASQIFAYILFIIAVALGIHLAYYLEPAGQDLFMSYHPIIGLLIFGLLFFQAALGIIHHFVFKKYQKRQFWSSAHVWLGRLLITLGIINGGLGLLLSSSYERMRKGEILYGVFGGLVWCIYVAAAVYGEVKKSRTQKMGTVGKSGSTSDQSSNTADLETARSTGEKVEAT